MQARLEQPLSGGGPYNPRQEPLGLLLNSRTSSVANGVATHLGSDYVAT
jgi:hypothetical protein